MAAKKKSVKKTARKAAKKRATKAAKKASRKRTAKKVTAKKARAKKATKKVAAKKTKKVAARKMPSKRAAPKKTAKKTTTKKPAARKDGKKAPRKPAAPKTKVDGAPVAAAKAAAKPVKLTAFVKKQRQKLLDLRDELMDVMYGVQQETLRNAPSGSEASGSGMHQGDAGSDAYDRDFALNLLSKEQDALHEIQAALDRIDRGAYGICEISGKKIPQARLEAIPFARLTVECQSQWEQEHPNRQFRTSDALGFLGGVTNGSAAVSLDDDDD